MKVSVQVIIESEAGQAPAVERIACMERVELDPRTLGLTLCEAKSLLASVQAVLVTQQVAEYVEQQRVYPHCGKRHSSRASMKWCTGPCSVNGICPARASAHVPVGQQSNTASVRWLNCCQRAQIRNCATSPEKQKELGD